MPYTPPSQRSPVASQSNTPRKLSISSQPSTQTQLQDASSHGSATSLPQSAKSKSYLLKHRRSPSISKSTASLARPATPETKDLGCENYDNQEREGTRYHTPKLPQSTQARANGTFVLPDESQTTSAQSSSDEEPSAGRGRLRDVSDLAELQAAIRGIEQHRESSPARDEGKKINIALDIPKPHLSPAIKMNGLEPEPETETSFKLPLSAGARKISHSRSSTDTTAFFDFPKHKYDSPAKSGSEDELDDTDEEDLQIKPSLIRKKSGELVRPALRASSTRRRPSSMPGTPTYSKAVHFQDNSLEHVRTFLQVDRPIAVSAGSSPVDSHDEDSEYPFGEIEPDPKSPPYEWEIRLTNFPRETLERQAFPVRTEKLYLSADTKMLMGNVAVLNLAFHKLVVARFTLDFWKTTSEVIAEYNGDVRKKQVNDGYDRFTFAIKLEDQANLENKTMFFCVKYNVGGKDYWDNNNSTNYQIDFSKKFKPQNGKQRVQPASTRPLNGLPRSKPTQQRPRSMPSFDDFGSHIAPFDFTSFPQPNAVVGDSPIRFRNRASKDLVPDAPGKPKASANQQAFGNRYDFGASLSAAISAGSTATPKVSTPQSEMPPMLKVQSAPTAGNNLSSSHQNEKIGLAAPSAIISKPTALTTEKPALQSSSYHELLDKYCFVRSRPTVEHQHSSEQVR